MRNTSDDGDTLVARSILSVRRVDRVVVVVVVVVVIDAPVLDRVDTVVVIGTLQGGQDCLHTSCTNIISGQTGPSIITKRRAESFNGYLSSCLLSLLSPPPPFLSLSGTFTRAETHVRVRVTRNVEFFEHLASLPETSDPEKLDLLARSIRDGSHVPVFRNMAR